MPKIYVKFGRIVIDAERINKTIDAYYKWKSLNDYIKSTSTRGINMPDAISEPMGCYCLGFEWNRGDKVGDAYDPKTGHKIEFKASSNMEDLSSFGPDTKFDNLYFLQFDTENDILRIYDLNITSEQLKAYPTAKNETFGDKQKAGKRPHISLYKLFVKDKNLKPAIVFDIRRASIIEDNR